MLKKIPLIVLVFLNSIFFAHAEKETIITANQMSPAFQKLLLKLSTTKLTVVKENQVDLDSSLIHVSRYFSLSRLPIVTEGIEDREALNNAGWIDQRKPEIGEKQLKLAQGREHASLSILLGAYFAFEPGNNNTSGIKGISYLTTGIKECDKWHDIKLKLAGQRLLAKLYLKNQNFAQADQLFSQVAKNFIAAGDPSAAATTYSWWGLYTPVNATSTAPRIAHTGIAVRLFKSLGETENQINSLMNESYLSVLQYNILKSVTLAKEALALSENIRFPYPHYITGALMSFTLFQGKFGEPLTYGIESVKTSEAARDSLMLPYFYGAIAGLYHNESNREDVEIEWEKKAIKSFLDRHEPSYMILDDIVSAMLDRGRKTEALAYINTFAHKVPAVSKLDKFFYNLTLGLYYTYTKQWSLAHSFYNKALVLESELEKHGLNIRKTTILINLANLYFNEGNYKQAKVYYNQYFALPSIINGGFLADKASALLSLTKIDSTAGDREAELKDYRQLTNVFEQNYTVSKTMLAEELQVKYATAAKTNQIHLLNQKEKFEKESLSQANLVKNITAAGAILLIIVAGLLYRQSITRKKNNDIITSKNKLMQKLLDEKEWLVKEIHHRVKNNLHTVICLLESQALYLENDALKAIQNSRHRIYAMSLIHQKLYQSEDIKIVNMKIYLIDFLAYLEESFGSPDNIKIVLSAESIKLGAGQAIPIGLIVNEAVTNAFKYAFPKRKKGEISVVLKQIDDAIFLSVSDNGVGFKQTDQELNSLGLELINGLALDLRGKLTLETDNGTNMSITFMIDRVAIPADEEEFLTSHF